MRADNSGHLAAAARERAEQTRARALRALRRLEDTGHPVTFEAVAREAGVSRSWLYSQPDIQAEIHELRARSRSSREAALTPQRQRATDASLLRRLEAATQRMRQLEEDNRELRQALAEALDATRARRHALTCQPRDHVVTASHTTSVDLTRRPRPSVPTGRAVHPGPRRGARELGASGTRRSCWQAGRRA